MEKHEASITVSNRIEELDRIVQALESLHPCACCSPRKLSELNLILEELVANIVSYGTNDGREHEIHIRFTWTDRELTIRIEDDGKPFNPITVEVPDTDACLADRCIGGLGIHLVRHFIDAFNYMREKGRNIMTLKKTISDPGSPADQKEEPHSGGSGDPSPARQETTTDGNG